jgi:hypothetical protein
MPFFSRPIAVLIAVAALSLGAATSAQAKIVIPCTGDRLVTVVEIPKEKQPPGETIDIGYRFPGCFDDGEWVGLRPQDAGFSTDTRYYLPMNDRLREALLKRAGLTELPPTPSRMQYPMQALPVETFTIGVLIIYAMFGLAKKLFHRRSKTGIDVSAR